MVQTIPLEKNIFRKYPIRQVKYIFISNKAEAKMFLF